MSNALNVVVIVAIIAGWFAVIAVNALKRKWGFTAFACIGSIWALIGVCRLARPGSWWYRKRYDDAKRALADQRYPGGRYWPSATEPARFTMTGE
jgi:hypothetical protein